MQFQAARIAVVVLLVFASGACGRTRTTAISAPAASDPSSKSKSSRSVSVVEAIPDDGTLVGYFDVKALRATPLYGLLLEFLQSEKPSQLNLGSADAGCGASLLGSIDQIANSSITPAPGVVAVRTNLSEEVTFACLRELFPLESRQDAGRGRLQLSDAYGVATFESGILIVAPSDQLERAILRIKSDEHRAIAPWLTLSQGETMAFHFVPNGIAELRAVNAWVSTADDGVFVRMRAEMDSAERAHETAERFIRTRGLLDKVRGRYPPELMELLRGAEFSAEGNVVVYRAGFHGDPNEQKRILTSIVSFARSGKEAPATH
jgi:hypothetical protein